MIVKSEINKNLKNFDCTIVINIFNRDEKKLHDEL